MGIEYIFKSKIEDPDALINEIFLVNDNYSQEDNAHIQNTMKNFEKVQNKRRRCYKMDI